MTLAWVGMDLPLFACLSKRTPITLVSIFAVCLRPLQSDDDMISKGIRGIIGSAVHLPGTRCFVFHFPGADGRYRYFLDLKNSNSGATSQARPSTGLSAKLPDDNTSSRYLRARERPIHRCVRALYKSIKLPEKSLKV